MNRVRGSGLFSLGLRSGSKEVRLASIGPFPKEWKLKRKQTMEMKRELGFVERFKGVYQRVIVNVNFRVTKRPSTYCSP